MPTWALGHYTLLASGEARAECDTRHTPRHAALPIEMQTWTSPSLQQPRPTSPTDVAPARCREGVSTHLHAREALLVTAGRANYFEHVEPDRLGEGPALSREDLVAGFDAESRRDMHRR